MDKSLSRLFTDLNSGKPIDNFQLTLQFKYILEKELSLEEFSKWFIFASEKLSNYNISFYNYFKKISFIKENEHLSNQFFKIANQIVANHKNINENLYKNLDFIIKENILGPIAFVTPEIGRWSTIGGLGVMVIKMFYIRLTN